MNTTFSHLQKCLGGIQLWMNSKKLKPNPSKTEFLAFTAAAMQMSLKISNPHRITTIHYTRFIQKTPEKIAVFQNSLA